MKRSPDNQINASFIDILRILWLVFFIAFVFLPHNKTVGTLRSNGLLSTSARSNRRHSRERSKTSWQWIYIRLYKFLAGTSKIQVLDKGIRQKSTKRVNSFIACSAFCPGPPNRDPRDSEKRWRVYASIAMMARHAWRVYKSSDKTQKKSVVPTKFAGLYGIRCELVKAWFSFSMQNGQLLFLSLRSNMFFLSLWLVEQLLAHPGGQWWESLVGQEICVMGTVRVGGGR